MKFLFFVCGLLVGAAVGVLLAPQSGRATRAFLRDKTVKYSNDVSDFTTGKAKHIANKARGYAHDVKKALASIGRREDIASYI